MKSVLKQRMVIVCITVFYSLNVFGQTIYKDKPEKTRDKLRFGYGYVVETIVDGKVTKLNCSNPGNMKCKAESLATGNPDFNENDLDNLDEMSEDLVNSKLSFYPTGYPPTHLNGTETKLVTIILPDGTAINRLYIVEWEWDVSGEFRETYDYIDQ